MLSKLRAFCKEYQLISKGDTVVCAVSGGADSMALLWALYLLKEEWLSNVFRQLEALDLSTILSEYAHLPSPYYVRMGMAWLLATALAKYPDQTRSFINASSLTEDVKRLYARKARESFRTKHVSAF